MRPSGWRGGATLADQRPWPRRSPTTSCGARCVVEAAEALGSLHDPAAQADLGELVDRFGRGPTGTPNYSPELHAELLYALGGRIDASADPHFVAALKSQEVAVRLAAVRAVGQGGEGKLPEAAADLRRRSGSPHPCGGAGSDGGARHPLAMAAARAALADYRLEVRLAAVAALGDLGGDEARQALKQLEREPRGDSRGDGQGLGEAWLAKRSGPPLIMLRGECGRLRPRPWPVGPTPAERHSPGSSFKTRASKSKSR